MHTWMLLVFAVALLASARCSIQFKEHKDNQSLSTTTMELLTSFKQCIVFVFDWALKNDYEVRTSTNYFIFYSKSISCSLLVETWMMHRNQSVDNPRFQHPFVPHPVCTKHTTSLINLYSSATTSIDRKGKPATYYVDLAVRRYNIPFNYILIFMSTRRFSSVDNRAIFVDSLDVSAPAVYILVLDELDAYVAGFAHVLQSGPYLFKVKTFRASLIQHLHETIHIDLQLAQISLGDIAFVLEVCRFGSIIYRAGPTCVIAMLVESFNATFCSAQSLSCGSKNSISLIYERNALFFGSMFTRRYGRCLEYINYAIDREKYVSVCIVQTAKAGLMAFLHAFDLSTWAVTATVCVCLTAAVATISNESPASWLAKLEPSAALVVMLLFERFHANAALQRAATRETLLVLNLWAFGAMLLGMSYSGNMISELAAPSLPPVPRDVHELSLSEYPIYTMRVVSWYENDIYHEMDAFSHEIHEYLMDNPGYDRTSANDLRRLASAFAAVGYDDVPVGELDSREGSKVLFAIAGTTEKMKGYGLRNVLMSSGLLALSSSNLPLFNKLKPLSVLSNPLLPIFRKFLANLCAPGICRYWEEGHKAGVVASMTLVRYSGSNKVLGKDRERMVELAVIWRDFKPLMDAETSCSLITVYEFIPAFQLLGICTMMSTLVLLSERWPFHAVIGKLLFQVRSVACGRLQSFASRMRNVFKMRKDRVLRLVPR